jgi:hypothetical protein
VVAVVGRPVARLGNVAASPKGPWPHRARRQAVKTISEPLRFGGVRTFEAIPGGTRITLTGDGRAGGFFGLAEPQLLRAAQRSLRTDLATRKRLLEGQTQA